MRGKIVELLLFCSVFWGLIFLMAVYEHNLEFSVVYGSLAVVAGAMSWGLDKERDLV